MIGFLSSKLAEKAGRLSVTYVLNVDVHTSDWQKGTLVAVDQVGIAIEAPGGAKCFPWSGLATVKIV